MRYQIISDSSCDLPVTYTQEKEIVIVPFYVSFDDKTYYKEGLEIDHDQFYEKMITEHAVPKTSLPSVQDYVNAFLPSVKQGIPILCICITTKFSGSYQSASTAKGIILETYPNSQITIIDSTVNTVLQGLLVRETVRMKENGLSYEETIENIDRIKPTGRIIFTIETMEYLKKGGRIGRLLTLAGDALGIRPLIILKDGEIFPAGMARGRKKSKEKLLELAKDHFQKSGLSPKDYLITIGTGIDYQEAEEFRKALEIALSASITLPIGCIGVTIGTHTGPHPIGLGLIQKYDC